MTLLRTASGAIERARVPLWLYKLMERAPLSARMRIGPEDVVGIEVGNRLRDYALSGRLRASFTHIPHEIGGAGRAAQARLALAKALGLIAGSGDYVFVAPDGGGWIEIKKPKTEASGKGQLNPDQKSFREWCAALGVRYAVAYSAEEVDRQLIEWGMLDA